jgi:hypothetical protein
MRGLVTGIPAVDVLDGRTERTPAVRLSRTGLSRQPRTGEARIHRFSAEAWLRNARQVKPDLEGMP